MHKLLARQLRRYRGSEQTLPSTLAGFVDAIDLAYKQADADRAFLEHTMDLTSRELMERQRQLQEALAKSQEAERQLAHQALHDALTGLPNRVLFLDRVDHALARSPRSSTTVAVLFIDLDDFKGVNDTLGHAKGDELLRATADRLRPMVRASDTCARLGGDEFAIVLEDAASPEAARVVAERMLAALRSTFNLGQQAVFVGASVGIAMAGPNETAAELMRNADLAMYMAKTGGKHRAVVFEPSMHTAVVRRVELEQDLRGALGRGEFALQFQPILNLDSGAVAGLEALVRWDHPQRGRIAPLDFIPIAEQSGAIMDLGRWILAEACRSCVGWDAATPDAAGLSVTVNVSGRELREPAFVEHVRLALGSSGLAPHRLVLELTENILVGNDQSTIDRLRALKELGVLLAIDDFGTGYSSLSYLQQFPVDIIKIDKSFVDDLGILGDESPLSRAVVSLGSALSLRTIAEGVETEGQFTRLRELGCPYAQGYLFARPLAGADVPSFLRKTMNEPDGGHPKGPRLRALSGPRHLPASIAAA
ncbi:MAG TPA: EAL domain-containing protein [Gemmatimonadaceae bacterium]